MFLSTLILNFCVHLSLTSAYGILKNFYPNVLPRCSVAWLLLKKRILFISFFNLTAFSKPSGLSKCVFQVIMHSKLLENSLYPSFAKDYIIQFLYQDQKELFYLLCNDFLDAGADDVDE